MFVFQWSEVRLALLGFLDSPFLLLGVNTTSVFTSLICNNTSITLPLLQIPIGFYSGTDYVKSFITQCRLRFYPVHRIFVILCIFHEAWVKRVLNPSWLYIVLLLFIPIDYQADCLFTSSSTNIDLQNNLCSILTLHGPGTDCVMSPPLWLFFPTFYFCIFIIRKK